MSNEKKVKFYDIELGDGSHYLCEDGVQIARFEDLAKAERVRDLFMAAEATRLQRTMDEVYGQSFKGQEQGDRTVKTQLKGEEQQMKIELSRDDLDVVLDAIGNNIEHYEGRGIQVPEMHQLWADLDSYRQVQTVDQIRSEQKVRIEQIRRLSAQYSQEQELGIER